MTSSNAAGGIDVRLTPIGDEKMLSGADASRDGLADGTGSDENDDVWHCEVLQLVIMTLIASRSFMAR